MARLRAHVEIEERALEKRLPGEPVAQKYGLRLTNSGLLWGIVSCIFQLLGCLKIHTKECKYR